MSLAFERFAISLRGEALLRLDCAVAPGEVLAVMGPSGSGKSSLLLAVAGLLGPPFLVAGAVRLDGDDLTALPVERRGMGMMFQDALLFPHMSVIGNVLFAVRRRDPDGGRRSRGDRRALALAALERVALGAFAERDPATLSGGQRSRVALARTLAGEPRALLLDEPFGALDQRLRAEVRATVLTLAREDRLPVVLVSHDPADAEAAGGRVVQLGPHEPPR